MKSPWAKQRGWGSPPGESTEVIPFPRPTRPKLFLTWRQASIPLAVAALGWAAALALPIVKPDLPLESSLIMGGIMTATAALTWVGFRLTTVGAEKLAVFRQRRSTKRWLRTLIQEPKPRRSRWPWMRFDKSWLAAVGVMTLVVGALWYDGRFEGLLTTSQPVRIIVGGYERQDIAAGHVRVIDGDTFALGWERVRIVGFDAPEISGARCSQERLAGERAKARLKEVMGSGSLQVTRQGTDQYGRTLARVTVGGSDVGQILVMERLALSDASGTREMRGRYWCQS